MRFKGVFKMIAMVPILVPSLLPGIALVYLLGKQSLAIRILEWILGDEAVAWLWPLLANGPYGPSEVYGPLGIVIASVFFTFPHALLIIITALSIADARLYEAAVALRAPKAKIFRTVTIPGARYGLISAAFVVFNLVITDFGVPKVIGGTYNVLAVDIYKQVIGQQNFQMGAVVSMVLLIPALFAFSIDRIVQKKQVALLSARAVPYAPKPSAGFDRLMFAYCCLMGIFILGVLGVCQYAALIKFWPYDLTLSFNNYNFDVMDGGGWESYGNSIRMALYTAVIGTTVVFTGAYMVEKGRGFTGGRAAFQLLAMMPMAIPGMVLGLAYIFFFNDPDNPLGFLYGTMAILVICTVTHFYTVSHLTAVTALKQMDPEFEAVSQSLKQPFYKMFARVTVPVWPAGDPGDLDLSLRQRHDHGLGRGLSLFAGHDAGVGCRAQYGRRRRYRPGCGHGHDDLLHQCRGAHPARPADPGYPGAHPGLAQPMRLGRLLLGVLLLASTPAAAEPVDLELVLLADASRSIDDAEIAFQRQGYAAALTHPEVLNAIAGGYLQKIAVSYVDVGRRPVPGFGCALAGD